MSRMIGFLAPRALTAREALGDATLAQFLTLSKLHADGWGTAWIDTATGRVRVAGGTEIGATSSELRDALAEPSRARVLYLRFASRGAPPEPANVQPFLRQGFAFAHNGLLAPYSKAVGLLSARERAGLRGTTDSEVYFSIVARENDRALAPVAHAVGVVRAEFPDACLNAFLLTTEGLQVIHSSGTRGAPHTAFATAGADLSSLPPGHADGYNNLWTTTTASGARAVSTTGIDLIGWSPVDADTVLHITSENVASQRITARPSGHFRTSEA